MNAWEDGPRIASQLSPDWSNWATDEHLHPALPHLDFDDGPGLRQWWNPQVGWGVVLPENEDLETAERASASDRVPAVAKLIEHRKAVVLRHRTELMPGHLRRYYPRATFRIFL
jgi:hypothetical protein